MSTFKLFQDLHDMQDLCLLEGTEGLTRSSFYKTVESKVPEFAKVLEGFWGSKDFVEFCQLTLDSIKLKKGKWKDLPTDVKAAVEKLMDLHNRLYPEIAKKFAKSATNYSGKEAPSAAAAGRHAERDWVDQMAGAK